MIFLFVSKSMAEAACLSILAKSRTKFSFLPELGPVEFRISVDSTRIELVDRLILVSAPVEYCKSVFRDSGDLTLRFFIDFVFNIIKKTSVAERYDS